MIEELGKQPVATQEKKETIISSIISFFMELFTLFIIGVKECAYILLDIAKYSWLGLKSSIIDPANNAFKASSKTVDDGYKATKKALKKKEKSKFEKQWDEFYNNLSFVKKQYEALDSEKAALLAELESEDAKRLTKATVYRYKAKTPEGKIITDNFTGFSKLDVNAYLVNEGYEVYKIETSSWINFVYGESGMLAKKMKNKDLIFWLTQLATYVKSGIPLTDAVRILSNQTKNDGGRKRMYNNIVYELTMGESFSTALAKQGTMFPSLLINMIKAAEASGTIEETLEDMANYYTSVESSRKEMKSAMTYPIVIASFASVIIVFIFIYILPQFEDIYKSMGQEIEGLTAAMMRISYNLQQNIVIYVLIIASVVIGLIASYKQIKAFRRMVQVFIMKLPVIGDMIKFNEIAIFTKTFSSLLNNSVYITESIDILSKITNNEIYKEIMFDTIQNIAVGGKISETFKDHWAVPNVAYYMIVTGESTGELGAMLDKVSKYYQERHSAIVGTFKSIIEPVLISSLAVIVGTILFAVLMPMYDLAGTITG